MANDREFWDVIMWRESASGKSHAVNVGYATPKTKSEGFYVNLYVLPLPDKNGRVSIEIKRPKNYTGGGQSGGGQSGSSNEIPWE